MAQPLKPETRSILEGVSAATISTALLKCGLRNQCIQEIRPIAARGRNMVGPAFTLRNIPAREDLNQLSVFQNPKHPQRLAIETCPEGHVFVVDSRGDARAASAGAILVTRLMVRGAAGFVTDGGLRDSPEIGRLEIPVYHRRPSAPTNLIHHMALEHDVPIGCGDVAVFPGDIVVGDDEAVVIIPSEIADEIAAEAREMTAFEDFVIEEVAGGRSIIGLYPATTDEARADFAVWRKKHDR